MSHKYVKLDKQIILSRVRSCIFRLSPVLGSTSVEGGELVLICYGCSIHWSFSVVVSPQLFFLFLLNKFLVLFNKEFEFQFNQQQLVYMLLPFPLVSWVET